MGQAMTSTRPGYRAYLLRLWLTGESHCRASLEDPHTGELRAFATLAQLAAFLEQAIEGSAKPGDVPANATVGGHNDP
jgi:hypothetical protein